MANGSLELKQYFKMDFWNKLAEEMDQRIDLTILLKVSYETSKRRKNSFTIKNPVFFRLLRAKYSMLARKYNWVVIDANRETGVVFEDIKNITKPSEVLYVANATFGQDAVKTAYEFDAKVSITGSILTMLDSDARAGAAISIKEVTKKPLKFEATGEKIDDFQIFNPNSMADRILGMGDVINLVKKAKDVVDEKEAEALEKKIKSKSFNYDDYIKQMSMIKKMGSIKSLLKMVPGMSALSNLDLPEDEMKKTESIIKSMTKKERSEKVDISFERRKRLANGSGTKLDDVNRLVKGFKRIKQFMKKMPTKGLAKGLFSNQMSKFGGNNLWR